jgi:hypothetical protein
MSRASRVVGIVLVAALLVVALYAAAGFWLVPVVLRSQLESILAETLSVEARVETLRFDPFRLRLEAEGFRMGGSADAPDASFEALRVDLAVAPLLGSRVVVEELRLEAPLVVMRIAESGALSVAGVSLSSQDAEEAGEEGDAAPSPEPPADEKPEREAPLADLDIVRLSIEAGVFRLVDRSGGEEVVREVGPIELRASDLDLVDLLRTAGKQQDTTVAELATVLPGGASLSVKGDLDVDPLRLDLQLELADFPLESIQPYLARAIRAELRSGRLGLQGLLRLDSAGGSDGTMQLHWSGDLTLEGLEVVEPGGAALLSWKELAVEEIDFGTQPLALSLGRVGLREPRVAVVLDARGLNLARAFSPPPRGAESPPAPEADDGDEAAPLSLVVGPVELASGFVRFEDRTIAPVYRVDLQKLTAKVDGFRMNPGGRSGFELASEVDGFAPLRASGGLTPLAPSEDLELELSGDGLELSSFSPYTGRYIGRKVEGGRGSFGVDMKVAKRRMESHTKITLDGLDFGESVDSAEATTLPVATATTLLADADGRIALDIPVDGDLNDPDFSYTGQLLTTLRSLVTRVVATPFKLVDGMVSYGGRLFRPEDLSRVAFDAEDDELSREERVKLDALAGALIANPELTLEIRGGAAPEVDGDPDELRRLARRRARAVQGYLEEKGVPGDRIRTGEVRVDRSTVAAEDQVLSTLVVH